ncbi:MAG: hypothetical protein BroJett012_12520 [Betaproteobacteria bacterium]|nr:MAG: hypothetical protein BroJett012_12520 [Betaproteobacteria bacterium]
MRIRVKQCMAPPGRTVRFEAGVGDVVLLANGNRSYVEATIRSVKSDEIIVVAVLEDTHEIEREISASLIQGIMIGG